MRYSIYELDCQLNTILSTYNTDDEYEAEIVYNNYVEHANKIRHSQVFIFDNLMCEFVSEDNI